MTKTIPPRWLDLEPGDSIIERMMPGFIEEMARLLLKDGIAAFKFEPQPQDNGQVYTIVTRQEMYEPIDRD